MYWQLERLAPNKVQQKLLEPQIFNNETMTKSPMNGTDTNVWKVVTNKKQQKGTQNKMGKVAQVTGTLRRKYEGSNWIIIKKEEMALALEDKIPSPKRKRETTEIIILDEDSDSKMDIDNEERVKDKVILVESSEDDAVLKNLLASKRTKGRSFVNFMDFDSDNDEDDNVDFEANASNADDSNDEDDLAGTHENTNASNDKHKTGFTESDEELFWTEDETKLAVALWNDTEPDQINFVNRRWYYMFSGRTAPLRYPSEDFTADAVKANKGRSKNDLINPWQKKVKAKEPTLVKAQQKEAKKIASRKQQERTTKKTVASTMFASNSQWLDKVEEVVKAASPIGNRKDPKQTPPASKITNHFKPGKVTPPPAKNDLVKKQHTVPNNHKASAQQENSRITNNPYAKGATKSKDSLKSLAEEMDMETQCDTHDMKKIYGIYKEEH